jgi:hypothetical protein
MKSLFFVGLLFFAIFFFGCKKSEDNQPISQTIKGSVLLFDENNVLVNDNSETIVSIENSEPLINVAVNSKGEFELPELNISGTTALVFSHIGYGTIKQYYSQSGLDSIKKGITSFQSVSLYAKSSVVVNSLSGIAEGDMFKMNCNVSVPNANSLNAIRFFIQKNNSDVSFNNCANYTNVSKSFPVTTGNNTINICMKCEEACGFQPGDTAYIKAYGDISLLNSFIDLSTNKLVFPCVNPNSNSSTLWFVVP